MNRSTFVTAATAGALVAASTGRAAAADVEYDLSTPTGTLGGSLLLPTAADGAMPVVLIVAGSGPTDRNGNAPGLALGMYAKLATAFAERGIATVRYDKRGIAASAAAGPSESDLRFDTYVDDAVAWIEKLRADSRFSRVTLVGHSEGSLIGMIAAQRARLDAYVSLEGAGFPADVVLRKQLAARLSASPELLAQSAAVLDKLVRGELAPNAPAPLAALFRPSVQPYLISWFKYDPRVEIAKVTGRVTIVQGTHDVQVSVEDAKALAAAVPSAQLVLLDGMTHVLTDDPKTTAPEQLTGAYADAARPLDARLVETLVTATRA